MTDVFCLNPDLSTTRRITRTRPAFLKEPDSVLREKSSVGGMRERGYFKADGGAPEGNNDGTDRALPLVSIITIVFNGEKCLEQTIRSVLGQSYDNIEYIIVDGGSKDGTLDVIRKYEDVIDYWISESDAGISDAFNKGIALSTGKYHVVLNADDWYEADGIKDLVDAIITRPDAVLACADARIVDEQQSFIKYYRSAPAHLMDGMTLAHNTCLLLTSAVVAVGAYDVGKRVAMDHHLMLRLRAAYGVQNFIKVDKCVSNYRMGGLSDKFAAMGFREVRDNVVSHGAHPLLANAQYGIHVLKHELSRWLYRLKLAK